METLVLQTEQLPHLLVASRSGLVQGWDPTTLTRVLSWACFFRQLHSRLQAQPSLWDTLKQHLSQRGLASFNQLRRGPELLGLALLENWALPSASRHLLLNGLFFPAADQEDSFVNLLARRRAASQLLLHHLGSPFGQTVSVEQQETLPVRVQAQLLLLQLQGQGENDGGWSQSSWALMDHLHYGPMFYRVVATALLEPGWDVEAKALLLPWLLLGDPARLSSFCRLLPAPRLALLCSCYPELLDPYLSILSTWGSCLSYNPVNGEWQTSGLKEDEVPWQEFQEHALCLYQKPEPLGSAVWSQLKQLKARDGDFEVRGLSVWTDLLLDMEMLVSRNLEDFFPHLL
ncbi:Fanconi anemia group F protein [Candoia aspera]|uniref:Fanconi anemia group F protein n=1 Tax=Candoia aspera TaxID=51853 RepID=UPI002FD7C101